MSDDILSHKITVTHESFTIDVFASGSHNGSRWFPSCDFPYTDLPDDTDAFATPEDAIAAQVRHLLWQSGVLA